VMKQLPEKTIQLIPFEMDKKAEIIIAKTEFMSAENLKKAPAQGNMGELATIRRELAMLKLDESANYIKDMLESVDKIVIFAYHHDVMNILKYKLAAFNPVILTGKHTLANKQKAVDDFQNKKGVRVFIGQIQAAGTGLTLTAASDVVFVESSWVPGEINQAIDRCHRIGQKHNVTAKFLVVEKSLDETMLKSIFDKGKIINQIMQ
jgi:SWI/SNF-related matrix-associated actin-dependent regulator of chromatin subfamily A-like protein 1